MVISIVGPRGAGKSSFLGVAIHEMAERVAPAFGGSFEGFQNTMEQYGQNYKSRLYGSPGRGRFPVSDVSPMVFNLRLTAKSGGSRVSDSCTLVFLDTDSDGSRDCKNARNSYIGRSDGFIFLCEPPNPASGVDVSTMSQALGRLSDLVRNSRGLKSSEKIDVPMAVVFSRFDMIEPGLPQGLIVKEDSPHCRANAFVLSDWYNVDQEVRALLRGLRADAFLSQLNMNYREYACFAVSALGLRSRPSDSCTDSRPEPHRIEDPVLWLLMKRKVIKCRETR